MRKFQFLVAIVFTAGTAGGAWALDKPKDPTLYCNGIDAHDGLVESSWHSYDPAKPREAEFFFTAKSAKNLSSLDAGLRELGFATRPTRSNAGRVATIDAVISEGWLRGIMPKICKLTTRLDIDFDGWDNNPMPEKSAG